MKLPKLLSGIAILMVASSCVVNAQNDQNPPNNDPSPPPSDPSPRPPASSSAGPASTNTPDPTTIRRPEPTPPPEPSPTRTRSQQPVETTISRRPTSSRTVSSTRSEPSATSDANKSDENQQEPPQTEGDPELSRNIAIGVGATVGVLLLISLIATCIRRRRKQRHSLPLDQIWDFNRALSSGGPNSTASKRASADRIGQVGRGRTFADFSGSSSVIGSDRSEVSAKIVPGPYNGPHSNTAPSDYHGYLSSPAPSPFPQRPVPQRFSPPSIYSGKVSAESSPLSSPRMVQIVEPVSSRPEQFSDRSMDDPVRSTSWYYDLTR